ncbi:MAG TPA: ABC transporter ATP-binding protein [Candidatus Hydrogenedentes bacterium]|nr:ABC transporter ATP-binding protein [Candidatus Hydrogenedentota bacterium]
MLQVEGAHIRLGGFSLRDVSFTVDEGGYFVLLGASGVGKTVLLEALIGLLPLDAGRILWKGEDITHERLQKRRLGLVYQDQALFPHMPVWRNIAYGMQGAGYARKETRRQVEALADEVGAGDLLQRYPGTLSGGEAQRVALARALAMQPRCLLLDEPLSALDTHARGEMRALLRTFHRKGQTVVHVTHDYEEALALASHIGIMENGTVVQTGSPEEVFHHPKSEFVARFIGIRNVFPGILERNEPPDQDVAPFVSHGVQFWIMTKATPGKGMMIVRSEDITLSRTRPDSSAQNCFSGRVVDVVPARIGLEVYVDIGVMAAALITAGSAERLEVRPGQQVFLSFKASAARFMEE